MVVNHIAQIFLPHESLLCRLLSGLGYFTAPVMCFLLAGGFSRTRSLKNYALRLLAFALLSQFPYNLAFTHGALLSFTGFNVLFTLLISLLILIILQRTMLPEAVKWILAVLLTGASYWCDWGIIAPIMTLLFYYSGDSREHMREAWALTVIFVFITSVDITSVIGPLLAAVFTLKLCADTAGNAVDILDPPIAELLSPSVEQVSSSAGPFSSPAELNASSSGPVFSDTELLSSSVEQFSSAAGSVLSAAGPGASSDEGDYSAAVSESPAVEPEKSAEKKKAFREAFFSKWFFYWFYPGHLLLLGIIRVALHL